MNKQELYQYFTQFMKREHVLLDEPMKEHTSFKIGGPADLLVMPESIDEIQKIIKTCRKYKIPYFVMGNGTNLLVRDKGMRCVVIKLSDHFSKVKIDGTKVVSQSGILLSNLSKMIMNESLKGFEFASGIPGTLGGAVTMNAGAYGGEMKDVVRSCTVIDEDGNLHELLLEEMEMGYRTSVIQMKGYIVVEVTLEFGKGSYEEIKSIIDDLTMKRTTKQPLHLPSAGSTFKRPPGYYAGKLIEDSNLKGVRIGDAQVSELHSGFIVNLGNATAQDVIDLIALVQKKVQEKFGVYLHPEVKIVGEQ